jgi:hypothetical protein
VAVAETAGDSASGTLQVAKDKFVLRHVFALMEPSLPDPHKDVLTVLLSDLPVPDDLRKASDNWRYWASEKAQAGAIHGIVLTIDPATGVWSGGHLLTRKGFMFYTETVSGQAGTLQFEAAGPLGDRAAGKVSMKEPMTGMSDEDGPWQVTADFSCAVVRRAAVSSVLTGEAAIASAPYKAVIAFLEICRKKDLDGIRNSVEPQSRESLTPMFSGEGKQDALNMFAQMAASTLALKVDKVTVRGNTAEVEFKSAKAGEGESQTLRVVLVGSEWKMAL